jgi:uncharacterized protein (TIGR03435 family)
MPIATRTYLLTFTLAVAPVLSQTAQAPHFEVAVIKPAPDCTLEQIGRFGLLLPGRLDIACATMLTLISGAYAIDDRLERRRIHIEGGPAWLKSATYSVTAKAEDAKASVQMMMGPMMRALVEERLALKTHTETREGPVYELTATKSGLKAKASTPDSCVPYDPTRPLQDMQPNSATFKNCGFRNLRAKSGIVMEGTGVTMNDLAKSLPLDRETLNRTGIEGAFNFVLRYSPQGTPAPAADSTIERWPEIFTAIGEQLGLRIGPGRGPVHFLIIDSVQKPAEN